MAKSKTELVTLPESGKPDAIDPFAMVLDLPPDALVGRAVEALNAAEKLGIGAGLCLLKAKELCSAESALFDDYLKSHSLPKERAYELMAIANLLQRATPEDRKRLMQQPKTALIGLARMDDAVRQQLLDTGKLEERLTLNEYKALLNTKHSEVARQKTTIEALTKQLRTAELTGQKALDTTTPMTVVQLRTEAASYAQDALACIHGFTSIGQRLEPLDKEAKTRVWVKPVALSMVSLLQALRDAADQQLAELVSAQELDVEIPEGAALTMAVPGPQEAEHIQRAMTGVLIDFERRHAKLAHAQYEQVRKAEKLRGRPRKAPGEES